MAKKTSGKSKGQKRTSSTRKKGASTSRRASGGSRVTAKGRRKAGGAKPSRGKAKKRSVKAAPARAARAKKVATKTAPSRKASPRKARPATSAKSRKSTPVKKAVKPAATKRVRRGGTGRESELAQTPETGRTVQGPTNPMKTKRSTGTPAGAGDSRQAPSLDRERRQLREIEETVQGPPSSLDMDRNASAARTGRRRMQEAIDETNETGPALTGGDVDADWSDAYAVGDEAPGGDNPTPDQDIVDDIGRALGVEYQDNEELKGADKIAERDRHRWELDPASSDDYNDRE